MTGTGGMTAREDAMQTVIPTVPCRCGAGFASGRKLDGLGATLYRYLCKGVMCDASTPWFDSEPGAAKSWNAMQAALSPAAPGADVMALAEAIEDAIHDANWDDSGESEAAVFSRSLAKQGYQVTALAPAGHVVVPVEPFAYAYEYHGDFGGKTIRFNSGQKVNGGKPIRAIPLYTADQLAASPTIARDEASPHKPEATTEDIDQSPTLYDDGGPDPDADLPTAADVRGILSPTIASAGEKDEAYRTACRLLDNIAPGLEKADKTEWVINQIDNAIVGIHENYKAIISALRRDIENMAKSTIAGPNPEWADRVIGLIDFLKIKGSDSYNEGLESAKRTIRSATPAPADAIAAAVEAERAP